MVPCGSGDVRNTLTLSWAVVKGSGMSGVTWMQTSELFKASFLQYLSRTNLLLPNIARASSDVEVSDWKQSWLHEPLDPIPTLARRKSICGSSSVPPRVSCYDYKAN